MLQTHLSPSNPPGEFCPVTPRCRSCSLPLWGSFPGFRNSRLWGGESFQHCFEGKQTIIVNTKYISCQIKEVTNESNIKYKGTYLIQKLDQFGAAFFSQHEWWIDRSPQIWIAENNSASAYILGVAPSSDVVTRRINIVLLGDANISLLTFICHWHPEVDLIIKYK